jgi:hypothetical protein
MRARLLALAASAAALFACQTSPAPAPREVPGAGIHARGFDSRLAWRHVEALARIGPRATGEPGNAEARGYLRKELERLGLEVREQRVEVRVGEGEPFEIVNLAGRIPGVSEDAIVIAAGYDTRPVEGFPYLGVNEAAAGPAVLLEMARVLREEPLPYTTWIVFLDGEAPRAPGEPRSHFGSVALARRLAEQGVLSQIRLALVIEEVCDPDLRIARDLSSQRIYREEFFAAAARLGHAAAFPAHSEFESPDASHKAFVAAGLSRTVALVDTSFGGGEPPGVYAGSADDDLAHCSAASLGAVGGVALEGLETLSARLAKIDRFAASPVAEAQRLDWDTLGGESPEHDRSPEAAPEPVPPAEAVP